MPEQPEPEEKSTLGAEPPASEPAPVAGPTPQHPAGEPVDTEPANTAPDNAELANAEPVKVEPVKRSGVNAPQTRPAGGRPSRGESKAEYRRRTQGNPRYGRPGPPINRNGPFYFGFVATIGGLLAWQLMKIVTDLSQTITLVVIAVFLAVGLDPLVRFLQRRGLSRNSSVGIVCIAVLSLFGGFAAIVIPDMVDQATELIDSAPDQIDNLTKTPWINELNAEYGVIDNLSQQIRDRASSGDTVMQVFGGVLGAGRAVLSGLASTFTVLILTLYFLASLNSIAEAGYRLVPRSRRDRVRRLGDEILRRIGGYVAGQVAVATINAVASFVMMTVLGIPYAAVLAFVVGLLGLIPLVGATIGAVIVIIVGLFQSLQVAIVVGVYYLIYQQVENYLIAPRIMSRTVAVPGAVALIAAFGGGALLGVLGALIAIPIAAAILLIIQEVVIPRQERA
ncbi:AI-2E family transporter [Kineosporia rhizophila]|uniref:AI-2E family transporter n=1 Tax=Kineosporia TaxID=49184 RepID=UPI001E47D38D|nr:AI-2E family transporter [Kineosporia sp. NBRC 101677]MCE0539041.1 AI-2E family transporter [Kineosporia rhizophila]GLY17857.1 AI-2E family transporter [Kineosporia sp. NBRC 101677]